MLVPSGPVRCREGGSAYTTCPETRIDTRSSWMTSNPVSNHGLVMGSEIDFSIVWAIPIVANKHDKQTDITATEIALFMMCFLPSEQTFFIFCNVGWMVARALAGRITTRRRHHSFGSKVN